MLHVYHGNSWRNTKPFGNHWVMLNIKKIVETEMPGIHFQLKTEWMLEWRLRMSPLLYHIWYAFFKSWLTQFLEFSATYGCFKRSNNMPARIVWLQWTKWLPEMPVKSMINNGFDYQCYVACILPTWWCMLRWWHDFSSYVRCSFQTFYEFYSLRLQFLCTQITLPYLMLNFQFAMNFHYLIYDILQWHKLLVVTYPCRFDITKLANAPDWSFAATKNYLSISHIALM